jgi:hypothetical protein
VSRARRAESDSLLCAAYNRRCWAPRTGGIDSG